MKPLKLSIESSAPILTLVDYNKIFHKLDELHTIHTVFYNDLELRISHWTDRHLIGDLFLSLVSSIVGICDEQLPTTDYQPTVGQQPANSWPNVG